MTRHAVSTSVLFIAAAIAYPANALGEQSAETIAPAASPSDVAAESDGVAALDEIGAAVPPPAFLHEHLGEDCEIVTERYPDGRVSVERQVVLNDDEDFVNHGNFAAYARDGSILGTGQYDMGQKTGEWTRSFAKGECQAITPNDAKGFTPPFTSVAAFQNDHLHGDWSIADEKGRTVVHWQFENGQRHGQWSWFNADGTIREQMTFANNQIASDIVASEGKEKFKVIARYVDGRELVHKVDRYQDRGAKRSEGHVLKPRVHEETTVDWWSGVIETRVAKTEGTEDLHGEWRFWHPNGKIAMQGTYEFGKQVGTAVWWHENGQIKSQGQYVEGAQHGDWITSYANGQRHSVGQYVAGKQDGKWISWHENGMRKSEETFRLGKVEGLRRAWAADGRRLRENTAQAKLPDVDDTKLR